jgi:hypothetical protein
MHRALATVVAALLAALGLTVSTEAVANGRKSYRTESGPVFTEHPKAGYYRSRRSGPQVRGFAARRGGYSYATGDTVNTYGDSRSLYGGTLLFRDSWFDRQTNAGPFDHGFFFDSGVLPRGGDSPYMH